MIPFAVVGSERNVIIDGKPVRGRKNRWGVVNVEDERHCEFVYLRDFLLRFASFNSLIWNLLSTAPGLTCKTSLRRPPKFTTRPSARSNSWRSRKPPPAPAPLLHKTPRPPFSLGRGYSLIIASSGIVVIGGARFLSLRSFYTFPCRCSVPYVLFDSGLLMSLILFFARERYKVYGNNKSLLRQTAGEPQLVCQLPGCLVQFFTVRTPLKNSKCPRTLVTQLGEFDVIYALTDVVRNIDALSWRSLQITNKPGRSSNSQ